MGVVRRLTSALEIHRDPNFTLTQHLITVSVALRSHDHIVAPIELDPLSISALKNEDLLPVVPEKRTWRGFNYVALCVIVFFYSRCMIHVQWRLGNII